MSSFELMELFGVSIDDDPETETRTISVDFAPEDGAVASAMRNGERPESKQMIAQCANTLAVLRVAQAPGADGDEYGERLFLPVWRQRELDAEHAERERMRRNQSDDDGGLYSLWQVREEG